MIVSARELTQLLAQVGGDSSGDGSAAVEGGAAAYLAEWNAGEALQAAALLHTFVQQGVIDLQLVADRCGAPVAALCAGYRKLRTDPVEPGWSGNPLYLQRIRCYVAAYEAPELAFLCIAELLHRVRTGLAGDARQRRTAIDEGRLVLAPLLEMLGMFALRVELEEQLMAAEGRPSQIDDAGREASRILADELAALLPDTQIVVNRYAQIHNMLGPGRGGAKLSLLPTLTLLVDDEAACYRVLHLVHSRYTPVDGGVVDTLYAPEINGYRSLNVWVVAPVPSGRGRINFTITPKAQHEINEWGLAAHVMRHRIARPTPAAWWNEASIGRDQIAVAAPGTLPERLFVFSPKGELFPFERGSTVVDFAYYVHSDLAEQCRRFLVNGRAVEPAAVLRHLDLVELEHDPRAPGPNRLWLHAAHTARARSAIDRYLKRQGQGSHHGQKILDERLKVLERHFGFNLPSEKVEQAIVDTVRLENLGRKEVLLASIAAGQFSADRLFHRIFEREILRQVEIPRHVPLRHHQL
nr:TGS domain-containing protein [Burkholderiaceae bacterium]